MKQIIEVSRIGKSPSKVIVGDALTSLGAFIPDKRVIVISDANLHRRYRELVGHWEYLLVGTGEDNKTLATAECLYRELMRLGADRQTFILGIGGGIVTDLAGFVASTYMRGVDFGFVATTLLSQVDASIGGKNGVNVDGFKNMVGTFNQPDFVLCDTSVLDTLPEREFRSGMAEIIKTAVVGDPELFALLEKHTVESLRQDKNALREAIVRAIKVKAAIVEADEREAGVRKTLNLGHTFGHAIEKLSDSYTHGEAVAIGMSMICDISVGMGSLDPAVRQRIKSLIERMGLPLSSSLEAKHLAKAAAMDKKRNDGSIKLITTHNIGDCRITDILLNELEALLR